MSGDKSGVYLIRCETTGKQYIGSSVSIYKRWSDHRRSLRKGTSVCKGLQNAWNKYGEAAFAFRVLEECPRDRSVLEQREQHFIDAIRPVLNMVQSAKRHVSDEHIAKLVALNKARFSAVTECPRGHPYDEKNTYINAGKRICRACNRLRIAIRIAAETPERRAARLSAMRFYHESNRAERNEAMRKYAAQHKAAKREYDRAYRTRKKLEK